MPPQMRSGKLPPPRRSHIQRISSHLLAVLFGAFMMSIFTSHVTFHSSLSSDGNNYNNGSLQAVHEEHNMQHRSRARAAKLSLRESHVKHENQINQEDEHEELHNYNTSRVSLQKPKVSKHKHLEALELEFGSAIKQKVVSCRKEMNKINNNNNKLTTTNRRCDAYLYKHNVTKDSEMMHHLAIYNPLPRDQFLCGGKVILGPKKWITLDKIPGIGIQTSSSCGYNLLGTHSFPYTSFPYTPTVENRGDFPGISVQKKAHTMDDTFSSGFTTRAGDGDKDTKSCDVKCMYSEGGTQHIYGMGAVFTHSMEGEVGNNEAVLFVFVSFFVVLHVLTFMYYWILYYVKRVIIQT